MQEKAGGKRGILATIGLLFGVVTLGVAGLGAINTAFDLHLAISTYGASTPLPDSWEIVLGVAAVGVLILALTFFGSTVARIFRAAKGRPLVRIGIVLGALVLLVLAGRGLQMAALVSTYGSMLAYYCTDEGTVEDVKEELAKGPAPEALDRCLYRTAQWGRTDLLEVVVKAGADFRDASSPEAERFCVLRGAGVDAAYVAKAAALGATPESCSKSEDLVHYRVSASSQRDDDETAAIVTALVGAGWSATSHPDFSEETPLELARNKKMPKTVAALESATASR
ncbi:MAG: hypothetical protein R3B72_35550 [Polyangiaceae bacterium]